MTEEEKLIALKAMVGGSDSDEVLSTYLKLAGRKIINRAYSSRSCSHCRWGQRLRYWKTC